MHTMTDNPTTLCVHVIEVDTATIDSTVPRLTHLMPSALRPRAKMAFGCVDLLCDSFLLIGDVKRFQGGRVRVGVEGAILRGAIL